MVDADKWRKKREKQNEKFLIPFIVAWVAITAGTLVLIWPSSDPGCVKQPGDIVDYIFYNGRIWTGEPKAYVEAMAVLRGGRIGCTGSLEAAKNISEPGTQYVDLNGKFVTPGFVDPHIHFLSGGLSLGTPDLSEVQSVDELKAIMQSACGRAKAGEWVQGIGWNEVTWGGPNPHKSWLDEVCPYNPVILHRICWHKAIISTTAAQLAGISETSKDPPGGRIYHDVNGITGLLAEAAMDIVKAKIPTPSIETKRNLVRDASHYLLSQGVTMTHDMGTVPTNETEAFQNLVEVYMHLAQTGHLPVRTFAFSPLSSWQRMAAFKEEHGTSLPNMQLFWGGLKEFADGSLGSKTALFHEPYVQEPGEEVTSGVRTIQTATLSELVQKADQAGLQVAVHAIGDLAVDEVLDVFESVSKQNDASRQGPKPRHRIEHAQHLHNASVAHRFARTGVHAVVNPLHLLPDKRVLKSRLGAERASAGRSYALNTLLRAGVRVSFASDFPVVKANPLLGIFSAVFRRSPSEQEAFEQGESVSLEAALKASTIDAARLAGLEDHLGSLRVGKLADFVVLSSDPLYMSPVYGLPKVLATYVGGNLAYSSQDRDATAESIQTCQS